jgi:putative GTP pyrophosphokinase
MKLRGETVDIGELKAAYQRTYPFARRLQDTLKEQIEHLLSSQNITLGVPVESRVKTWGSLGEKIERKALTLSAVEELDDLVGLRLILLFRRDVAKVCDLLSNTFDVVTFEDASQRLTETQFGYQSLHYVVRLPRGWLSVPTLQDLGNLKAEVQVRTLTQHIWAAASHKFQYKHEESVPRPVRRAIHRVSALLETVDLEFERVLSERESYLSAVGTQDGEADLNVDLLAKILDELLPAQNKSMHEPEDYADLLADLRHFTVDTVDKLRGLIDKHLEGILDEDVRMAKLRLRLVDRRDDDSASKQRLERGIFFTHVGLIRTMLEAEFGEGVLRYLRAKRKP